MRQMKMVTQLGNGLAWTSEGLYCVGSLQPLTLVDVNDIDLDTLYVVQHVYTWQGRCDGRGSK